MPSFARSLDRTRASLRMVLSGPQVLAFMPAIILSAFWLGGEALLIFATFLVPGLYAAAGLFGTPVSRLTEPRDGLTGLPMRTEGEVRVDAMLAATGAEAGRIAAIAVGLDEFEDLEAQFGASGRDQVLAQVAARLSAQLRGSDFIFRLSGADFGVVLTSLRRADLETLIQIATRLQAAIAEPLSLDATRVFVTASVGFCLPDAAPSPGGKCLLQAAETALDDARANGPGSIRAFAPQLHGRAARPSDLAREVEGALFNGEIGPWFQPQIRTDTGEVSGVEALARWAHPVRGLIPPADFLPVIEEQGLAGRLSERILHLSLAALQSWDRAGLPDPCISVNFATEELRNPQLIEKVRWELDRFGLSPERLTIEVLETVIATTRNDTVVRNLRLLSDLGCGIDLDDFGTGHAAIGNIRRFSVRRIKIDKSFVTRIDADEEQHNVVSAILLMAERLGLDTLAEGVETPSEHGALARLGCRHVQGYGIARPMPDGAMLAWLTERAAVASSSGGPPSPAAAPPDVRTTGERGKTA